MAADGISFYFTPHAYTLVSPISRLPPEILVSLFRLVADANPPHYKLGDRDNAHTTLGWICLSHVNRRWRHICLKTPDLWARHIGVFPNFSAGEEFIARTGKSVLVDVCVKRGNDLRLVTFFDALVIEKLLTRIATLTWCTPSLSSIQRFRRTLQSMPLPSLSELDLEYETTRASRCIQRLDGYPADLPNLASATFNKCLFLFHAPALAKLELVAIDVTCAELFDIFQWLPLLKRLCMTSCSLYGGFSACAIASLPLLENLRLWRGADDDAPRSFKGIMDHLSMPPHTFLDIGYYSIHGGIADLDFITPAVRSIWREDPPCGLEIRYLELKFYSGPLHSPLDELFWSPFQEHVEEDARARLGYSTALQFAQWLNGNLSTLHAEFASITTLSVDMNLFRTEHWINVFRALPNLRNLHLIRTVRLEHCFFNSQDARHHSGPDEDELAEDVFTALAATVDLPTSFTSSNAFGPHVVLPQLDFIWLTRAYEEATKSRAKLHAQALSTVRLDIIAEPKERRRGNAYARLLCGFVEDVRWRLRREDSDDGSEDSDDSSADSDDLLEDSADD
ncbi:hypothetical protein PENSPDRAFT_45661 [Peniophora sp. CONT]|nr:hypothetical protein PENSPDRAFT_45661 [Peniophora sp. CONT]